MSLQKLFSACAEILDENRPIEQAAKACLLQATPDEDIGFGANNLPPQIDEIMRQQDALPPCDIIRQMAFFWSPPTTSASAKYIKYSQAKSHVELVGPEGLTTSDSLRIGLYGMVPNSAYDIRTHPAEEIYIMLAGEVFWKVGGGEYSPHYAGSRSYHPSYMEHANMTREQAFLSIYIWCGDVSTTDYHYAG